MLRILNHVFEEDFSERESRITFINDEDIEEPCLSIDCIFCEKEIENDFIRPIIGIDSIDVNTRDIDKLVGEAKQCEDFEQSEWEEDYLYFYDQEPFQNYEFKIVEVIGHRAHIVCSGLATLDSDEDPMTTAEFVWDTWLPIIENYSDWDEFELDEPMN